MDLRTIFEAWLLATSRLEHVWPAWRVLTAELSSTLQYQQTALLRRDDGALEDLNPVLQEHGYAGVDIELWNHILVASLAGRKFWRL